MTISPDDHHYGTESRRHNTEMLKQTRAIGGLLLLTLIAVLVLMIPAFMTSSRVGDMNEHVGNIDKRLEECTTDSGGCAKNQQQRTNIDRGKAVRLGAVNAYCQRTLPTATPAELEMCIQREMARFTASPSPMG